MTKFGEVAQALADETIPIEQALTILPDFQAHMPAKIPAAQAGQRLDLDPRLAPPPRSCDGSCSRGGDGPSCEECVTAYRNRVESDYNRF